LRWWVLALAAIAVSSSYYNDDVIGPIADLLHRQRGFSKSQLGMLNGVISIPNVALALINGLLIDRYGPARIAFWSAAIGVLGAARTAVGSPYPLMVAVGGPLRTPRADAVLWHAATARDVRCAGPDFP
jgi:nitrate/nitrite transporter NarK